MKSAVRSCAFVFSQVDHAQLTLTVNEGLRILYDCSMSLPVE